MARTWNVPRARAKREGASDELYYRSQGLPSKVYGAMEQGHCKTCQTITPWTLISPQTLEKRNTRVAMTEGLWHKAEPAGGYFCATCGNRPYSSSVQPGRQRWPWEGP